MIDNEGDNDNDTIETEPRTTHLTQVFQFSAPEDQDRSAAIKKAIEAVEADLGRELTGRQRQALRRGFAAGLQWGEFMRTVTAQ
jgi:hypothetical protein